MAGTNIDIEAESQTPTGFLNLAASIHWRILFGLIIAIAVQLGAAPLAQASTPVLVGYRDHSFPNNVAQNEEVTSEKPESKLWWNDGSWWASMWSTEDNSYNIFRLEEATQTWEDTHTALDTRIGSRADILWDEDEQLLYVVSHLWHGGGGQDTSDGGKLFRYSYSGGAYHPMGSPINVNSARSESLVIDKDSEGQLWVTWVQDNQVMLNHSMGGDDSVWADPFPLPGADPVDDDDLSTIIAYGGHVGVMWSDQEGSLEMYFAVHEDGADPDDWTVELAFSLDGDDHINLKNVSSGADGNIYAVIKGDKNESLIVVLVCQWDDTTFCTDPADWDHEVVYNSGAYNPTRPIILVDEEHDELYVFTRNELRNGGHQGIYYKVTDRNNLSFSPGDIGIPFIFSETEDGLNDPTSTKQNLNSETGMAVLASDSDAQFYFHNHIELDGRPQHVLTVDTDGPGGGEVLMAPHTIVFKEGDEVLLTAVPDATSKFDGWSGDETGTDSQLTVIMDGDKSITATFSELPTNQHVLTVNRDPLAGGTVALDPPGTIYDVGTVVTLTAMPTDGWRFVGWSGNASGDSQSVQIEMDDHKTVTAHFEEITTYTLAVGIEGPGTVELDPDLPGGIYPQDTEVTLTAVPVQDWAFDGWGGDLTGNTNPITLTMDSDKTITASFVWPEHPLTVNTLGSGSVTLDPPDGPYSDGAQVTLTAVADPGWSFSNWSGDLTGTDNPATVTMDHPKEVTATFIQQETGIQIQVSADPITATLSQEITYTYLVANIGEATLNDVVVMDDRLGAVMLDKTMLDSGETAVGQLTYHAVRDDLPGPLENTATATAISVLDEEVSHSHMVSVALEPLHFTYMPLGLGSDLQAVTAQDEAQAAPEDAEAAPGLLIIREIEPQH